MTRIPGRKGIGPVHAVASLLLLLSASTTSAQPYERVESAPFVVALSPAPPPADVLTPNTRSNTPYLKIALRLGPNWTAYSNDRYLDNTPLDVGRTSGELDMYSHAAGFGFGGGAQIEYPINTGLSVVGSAEYARAQFGKEGPVQQECVEADDRTGVSPARHDWSARLDYLKIGAVFKLTFSSFYVLGGLTGSRLLSSSVTRTRTLESTTCSFPGSGGARQIDESGTLPDPSGIHFSLRTGFGIVYPIAEGLQFSPELTLDFGMSSINKSPESDLDIYSVSAVLRYELR
jgi:hypothetical protein